MYFLDTNTCIYFLNGKYENIRDRLLSLSPAEIRIPVIVKAELLLGAHKSVKRRENLEKAAQFLEPFDIVPFTDSMTLLYAEIRSEIERKGMGIGPNDVLIASIVQFHEGTLVTNNVREFERVPGLKIENWAI